MLYVWVIKDTVKLKSNESSLDIHWDIFCFTKNLKVVKGKIKEARDNHTMTCLRECIKKKSFRVG